MSSVYHLREFICGRLTAAAAEIFSEFEKTILRYEEEMERQRRLLDLCWKPELKLHRVDLQQEPDHKKLCKQERNSSLDQEEPEPPQFEEPEPPQMKVEDEELCTNQEEDQLHLKQETDPVLVTVLYKESEPEPDKEQLISQSSAGPEDQDQDSGSDEKMDHTEGHHGDQAGQSATSERLFSCLICGETFSEKLLHSRHVKVHKIRNQNSDKLMYCCPTCGKNIPTYSSLVAHMRVHTGLKPFFCKTCGKCFNQSSNLYSHMKIHTGEKPFFCKTCGKHFKNQLDLNCHTMTHKVEKPLICKTCRKCFKYPSDLKRHAWIHTGEKPYSCNTCPKRFYQKSHLESHMNVHRNRSDVLQSQVEES